jgi:hypothetical protein
LPRKKRDLTVIKSLADLEKAVDHLDELDGWAGPGPGEAPAICAVVVAELIARVVLTYEDTALTPTADGGVIVDTEMGDWYVHPNGDVSRFPLKMGEELFRAIVGRRKKKLPRAVKRR